jgi:ABC-type multidrug transport system fused ATPase/permease subunit
MGIMSAMPNLNSVKSVLEDKSYTNIENGTVQFETKSPNIWFDHVTFRHDATRAAIFNDLSLHIEAKKTTAIIGISGSGKSTIIDLILRLYDVQAGAIFIDNINIKEYDIATLRKKIGFVSQETFIFNASIEENIVFGQTFSHLEVIKAAELANIHDFIVNLPQQYKTVVGDRGVKLSGGERQRIAIARAIIRKPELLILDEATSSLDNLSEKAVQDAINNVVKKCTTVIVAHRLSTIKDADHIYVLENGKCIEGGTHEDLMVYHGKYWRLYTGQTLNAAENNGS